MRSGSSLKVTVWAGSRMRPRQKFRASPEVRYEYIKAFYNIEIRPVLNVPRWTNGSGTVDRNARKYNPFEVQSTVTEMRGRL